MQISNFSGYSQKTEKNFQSSVRTPFFGAKLLELPDETIDKIGNELNGLGKTQDLISLAVASRRLKAVTYGTEGSPGPLRKRLRMKAFYQVLKSFFNKDKIADTIKLTNSEIINAFKHNTPKDRKNHGESIGYFNQLKDIMRRQNKLETIKASNEWAGHEIETTPTDSVIAHGIFSQSNASKIKTKLLQLDTLSEKLQEIPTRACVSLALSQPVSRSVLIDTIEHFLTKNDQKSNTGLAGIFSALSDKMRTIHPSTTQRKDAIMNFADLSLQQEGPEMFRSIGLAGATWLANCYAPSSDKLEILKHVFNLSDELKSKQNRKLVNDALKIAATHLQDSNQQAQLQALLATRS